MGRAALPNRGGRIILKNIKPSFRVIEAAKWAIFGGMLLLLFFYFREQRISTVDFNIVSNDLQAEADLSLMKKAAPGELKEQYQLDAKEYQGVLYYVAENFDHPGWNGIDQATTEEEQSSREDKESPAGHEKNPDAEEQGSDSESEGTVAEQDSIWQETPNGAEEFLLIRLKNVSQARVVKRAIRKHRDELLRRLTHLENSETVSRSAGEAFISSSTAILQKQEENAAVASSDFQRKETQKAVELLKKSRLVIRGDYVLYVCMKQPESIVDLFYKSI